MSSNLTWNRATFDQSLSGRARMVPGTRMVISVANARQRATAIDYLTTRR